MVQGVDVWLNTPRRPNEASGTSGMKVIYNGGLNASILDGWWAEGYDPSVGWAIGSGEEYEQSEWDMQDYIEAQAMYNMLEKDIIPTFYTRGRDGLPREWIARIKASMRKLAPFFNTYRMVREYTEEYYIPSHTRFTGLILPDMARGKAYARLAEENAQQLGQSISIERVTDRTRSAQGQRGFGGPRLGGPGAVRAERCDRAVVLRHARQSRRDHRGRSD